MESNTRTYFLANACQVCKSKDTAFACEICRMIFYCSPEHRRENWFDHSQLCWALNKICQTGNRQHLHELFDGKDFVNFKHEIARKCIGFLGRRLEPWECEMIYHPRVCDVCHGFNWEKLQSCEGCNFVYTCEKRHFRKDHSKWCKIMKIYSEIIINASSQSKEKSSDFEKQLEIKNGTLKSMNQIFSNNFKGDYKDEDCVQFQIEKALISELLTYPLTVLNSLKLVNAASKREITVLFIGAEIQAEVEPLNKWEKYLLHNLAEVEVLDLIFLGPELRTDSQEYLADLCETCRKQRKKLRCEFVSGKFYHEYCNTKTKKPDLICALNSGMYREFGYENENSWEATIYELFKRGDSPVLVTEYTCHELKKNLEKIRSLCGNVATIAQPKMNPFASLKPGLNIISEYEAPVIFKNYFYVILKASKNIE